MFQPPEWTLAFRNPVGRPPKYPLKTMELNEVISIKAKELPSSGYDGLKRMLATRGSILRRKFVSRQLEDGTIEVCRVK